MNRNTLFFILLFALPFIPFLQANGQQNDFQFWPSAQLNVEVLKDLKLHIEEELRLRENVSQFSRQINDIGVSYRFDKYVKAAVYYRHEANWKNDDDYTWRSGIYGDVSLRYEPKRFAFGYRLRIQSLKVERNDKQGYMFNGFRHRHKISAEYSIKGSPFSPYTEGEIFIDYSKRNGSLVSGYRTWVGVKYAPGKMHAIAIKYGIDQELNAPDPLRAYIVTVNYSLNLKLKSVK
jgi:hypothetical protein